MKFKRTVLILVFLCAALFIGVCVWQILVKQQHEEAFGKVKIGDSLEQVTVLFGKPSRREICAKANPVLMPNNDASHLFPKCAQQYWYFYVLSYFDLGAWVVQFDENGKVSGKDFVASQ